MCVAACECCAGDAAMMVESRARDARLAPIACARRTTRIRWSCASAPTSRCKLDAGVELAPFQIAYQTYGTLNAERSQRGADLPRAHRRPARRQRPSGHRQAGLVGDHGRPRQADRHRALFRHLPERGRRLHGHDRAGLDQSEDRQAVGPRVSRSSPSATWCARRRCCSTISASTRCSRSPAARWAACRCCNGRRAIRSACSPRCRSPARRAIRRRTSPSTRSAARR